MTKEIAQSSMFTPRRREFANDFGLSLGMPIAAAGGFGVRALHKAHNTALEIGVDVLLVPVTLAAFAGAVLGAVELVQGRRWRAEPEVLIEAAVPGQKTD